MRTIRNIIIKQNSPADDDSVIYEIFNRFKLRTFENLNFDFGNVIVESRSLEEVDINTPRSKSTFNDR